MIQLVGGGNHHGTAESEDEARPLVPLETHGWTSAIVLSPGAKTGPWANGVPKSTENVTALPGDQTGGTTFQLSFCFLPSR